jgi:hypothetical protein
MHGHIRDWLEYRPDGRVVENERGGNDNGICRCSV